MTDLYLKYSPPNNLSHPVFNFERDLIKKKKKLKPNKCLPKT